MDEIYEQLRELEARCYDTTSAAALLHISNRGVRHLIEQGKLEAISFMGGPYIISPTAIQRFARQYRGEIIAELGQDNWDAISSALRLEIDPDDLPSASRAGRR